MAGLRPVRGRRRRICKDPFFAREPGGSAQVSEAPVGRMNRGKRPVRIGRKPARRRARPRSAPPGNGVTLAAPELRWIYDTAPIGLAFLSPDCRYLQINQRLTDICGISVEGHLGRTVREMVPRLADQVEALVRAIATSG